MIEKEDGESKNDCEQNEARRFAEGYRRGIPVGRPSSCRTASKGPHIKLLRSRDLRYILVARPGDRKFPFDRTKNNPEARTLENVERTGKGPVARTFRWLNDAPLNETHFDVRAHLPVCAEERPDGSKSSWSRAADLPLDEAAAFRAVRAARSRWRIENETLNTLKNHDCEF
ncbi:MAG: hypothetical protein OXN84_19505 [Albidovulum sp.]|nr:hypothetical protein [Albidovulum sp.]